MPPQQNPNKVPKETLQKVKIYASYLLYLGSGCAATLEMLTFLDSMISEGRASRDEMIATCIIAFSISANINGRSLKNTLHELITTAKTLPKEHPLSKKQKALIYLLTLILVAVTGVTDASKNLFFLKAMIENYPKIAGKIPPYAIEIIKAFTTAGILTNMTLTEGYGAFEAIMKKIGGHHYVHHQGEAKYPKPVLVFAALLILLDTLQEMFDSGVTLIGGYGLTESLWKFAMLPLTFINAMTNLFVSGVTSIYGLNQFYDYVVNHLIKEKKIEPQKMIAFLLALALAIYLALEKRFLHKEFDHKAADTYEIDYRIVTNYLFLILSWMTVGQESILGATALYPVMKGIVQFVSKKTSDTTSYVMSKLRCTKNKKPDEEAAVPFLKEDALKQAIEENEIISDISALFKDVIDTNYTARSIIIENPQSSPANTSTTLFHHQEVKGKGLKDAVNDVLDINNHRKKTPLESDNDLEDAVNDILEIKPKKHKRTEEYDARKGTCGIM